jgi:hypothetical protein
VVPSLTGNGTHGQGIANDFHANTVAKKAEDAAAQALAAELKAMRADKAKAQSEADARYAGSLCTRAFRCTDGSNLFRWARLLAKDKFVIPGALEQR